MHRVTHRGRQDLPVLHCHLIVRRSVFFDPAAPALLLLLSFLPPPRLRRLTAVHQHPPLFVAHLLLLPFNLASGVVLLGGVMWDPALKPSTTVLAFSLLHMLATRQESNQNIHESLLVVAMSDRHLRAAALGGSRYRYDR